jgi:hypothetical protein
VTRPRAKQRIANDNGTVTDIVSVTRRREDGARGRSLMRDWAPAILATFFDGSPWNDVEPDGPDLGSGTAGRSKRRHDIVRDEA